MFSYGEKSLHDKDFVVIVNSERKTLFTILRDTMMKLRDTEVSILPDDELFSSFKDTTEEELKQNLISAITSRKSSKFSNFRNNFKYMFVGM